MGKLDQFPEAMREFDRKRHDGIILDDIRDFDFLVQNQDKLQCKYDMRAEFATTPGGTCAFRKWLWKVPIVVTANGSTKNPELLQTDDFLGHLGNRVYISFPPSAR